MNSLPLKGIRVVDFTLAWAGPYATMLLSMMGAEIIKVESRKRIDHSRLSSITTGQVFDNPNMSSVFNDLNLGKRGVNLDLKKPKSIELALELFKVSDIVMANMRPGVMKKLGLGYDEIKKVKPDIIVIDSSARGSNGPEKNYIGYAPSFGALSGLSNLTGHPDSKPASMMGEVDLLSATTAAFAILVALEHRKKTGEGQYIDLSSSEAMSVCIGEAFLDYFMNGNIREKVGNQDGMMVPHNSYQCKGKNRWISIAVETEEEWSSFCKVIGKTELINDERFSDAYGRWENQDELDKIIDEWAINYDPFEIMKKLQEAGIAASPRYTSRDLFEDEHLKERNFARKINHPVIGERTVIAEPWKYSTLSFNIGYGPLLGEHNDYIFGELLGLSTDEVKKLVEEEVIF